MTFAHVYNVNNQHDIKRRRQDFDLKKVCVWRGTQRRGWQTNFLKKAEQSMVLISYSKTCGTHAQLTGGQAVLFTVSIEKDSLS